MAAPQDFLPRVLPWTRGCPAIVAEAAVVDAARAFCSRTGYWQEEILLSSVTDEVTPGTGVYTVAPTDANSDIVSLADPIYHADQAVHSRQAAWLTDNYSIDWRTLTGNTATYFNQTDDTTFQLVPFPTTAAVHDIRVPVILYPAIASATPLIGDILLRGFMQEIGWGAIAQILEMPDQPWSDPKMAVYYGAKFDNACDLAQSQALGGFKDSRFKRKRTTRGSYF